MASTPRYGRALRPLWLLQEGIDFLNHGSYGAAPRRVLAAQTAWRARMERQPVEFLSHRLPSLLRHAASRLAAFLGARGEDLVFVDNATSGANAVLRSFPWKRGDVAVLLSHAYPAVQNATKHVALAAGATVREAKLAFPPRDAAAGVRAFEGALTARTRLAVIDHVTSPTALVLPIREIAAICRRRGVRLLVDGAHAPGMLDLDVPSIGADWYVGNCHKWLCAPKGCGFLWASKRGQKGLHPTTLSNHYGEGFLAEFDWCGTRDPSAWLSVETALDFHASLGGARLRRRNRELALATAARLSSAWGFATAPPELCGSMAAFILPTHQAPTLEDADRLHAALWRERIEVPIFVREGLMLLRISAQAYNQPSDYDRLARVLPRLLARQ